MLNNQRGFTLIEIIIVVVALAVISAIALPNITGSIESSRKATDLANAKLIYNATKQTIEKNNTLFVNEEITLKITEEALDNKEAHVELKKNIQNALNNEIPLPKYKNAEVGNPSYFLLKIDQKGNITVLTGSDDPAFIQLQVAPEPDMAFK